MIRCVFATALLVLCGTSALADEVRVLAAGASQHALQRIAADFETATGHRVRATYDTVGAQRDRVLARPAGAAADVVILSDAALAQLEQAGKLQGPRVRIGEVVVALAVPRSAVAPDVTTAAALRDALLAAPSIAYADPARGATAGSHFARVVDALGLRDALQARITVLPFGGDVIMQVAQGRFALGVSQSSEILQHPEVRYAGALPPPYGLATGYGAAAASDSAAARALLDFLARPESRAAWRESGFVGAP
jgi:molybdate transport system substrate-binding protein